VNPSGVLIAFCLRCMCEWHTDMVEVEPGTWRAADPADSNLTRCSDCDGELIMPERIERPDPSKRRLPSSAEPERAQPSPNPEGSS
jgi:hypothetical protein